MEFEASYFEDEVREGFYIPGMTKRSWAAQMDVLEVIAKICDRHDIKWYADCGTLLGTVRHGGFIPWDDDLDICMLRDDYIRFNQVARDEVPDGYRVLNFANEPEYDSFITRITNSQAIHMETDYLMKHHGFPYVAGVDIFPLDYLFPDGTTEENRRDRGRKLWDLTQDINAGMEQRTAAEIIAYAEEISGMRIDRSLPLSAALLRVIEAIFQECPGEHSENVALMPFWIKDRSHRYPVRYFEDSMEMPFETIHMKVPAAYDEVLQIEYGRWEIASKKGGIHGYPFYKEQEKMLIEKQGKAPYRYIPEESEIIKNEGRKKHAAGADANTGMLKLMEEAHEAVCKSIEKKDFSSAMELLENCQELAVKVGTAIEEKHGEGSVTVKLLEDYCEQIFVLHERIACGEKIDTYQEGKKLSRTIGAIQNHYMQESKRRKEILFLPVKAQDWNALDSLYEKTAADPETDVYVMPVPYAERLADGSVGAEHYELSEFPARLNLVDYRTYDFGHKHPDVIMIQNPYDEFASGITVHPFFYAKNIRQYTEKLVYIPSFVLDEIDPEDEKAIATIGAFAMTPGVIYADKVIAQSEEMRKHYIDCLTGYMGRSSRQEWEHKIIADSDLFTEKQQKGRETSDRKTILFYLGFSDYYVYGMNAVEKLKEVVEVFKGSRDKIRIIWISDECFEKNMRRLCPGLYEKYLDIVKDFDREQIGERRLMRDVFQAVSECDAYYGAGGYAMNLCVRKKVPVMLRNIF